MAPVSLLHLDVRAGDLLSVAGELRAVVDWAIRRIHELMGELR